MTNETEHLPCPLTDEEWSERSEHCARLIAERDTYAEEAKREAKAVKEELAGMDAQIRGLSREIRDRRTWRDVQVRVEPDYEAGVMETTRCDTGEVIRTRPLTLDEKQQKLPTMDVISEPDPDLGKDDVAPARRSRRGKKADTDPRAMGEF